MKLTRRGWVLVALGAFGAYAAHRTGEPVLLLLSSVAAMATLVSALVARRLAGGLVVTRVIPDWAYAGEPFTVRLRLTNRGPAKYLFSVVDEARIGARHLTSAVTVDALGRAERSELSYACPAPRRGLHRYTGVRLESGAPFGLLRASSSVSAPGSVLVVPKPGRVRGWNLPAGRRNSGIGAESPERGGASLEYFASRDYRPEDPMRHIHWKLTARMRRPMVREFLTTSSPEAEVVPDLSEADYRESPDGSLLDAVVALTATLCGELVRQGAIVRLWLFQARPWVTAHGAGRQHLRALLGELALAGADSTAEYASSLRAAARRFSPGSAVVSVIAARALADSPSTLAALGRAGHAAQLMVVHSPADGSGTPPPRPWPEMVAAVAGRAGIPAWSFPADGDMRELAMIPPRVAG